MPRRSPQAGPVEPSGQTTLLIEHVADQDGQTTPTVRLAHCQVILATYDPAEVEDNGERQAVLICFDTDDVYDGSFEDRYAREVEKRLAEHFGVITKTCYWDQGYLHLSFRDGLERERLLEVAHIVRAIERHYEEALEAESKERVADLIRQYRELPSVDERRRVANEVATDFLREACQGHGVSLDALVRTLGALVTQDGRSA